jgi:hypothetical protein
MWSGARHAAAVVVFAAVTASWLRPVWGALSDVVVGAGAGDNLTFVWDAWWMGRAIADRAWPLSTSLLFAPWGTDLTLHTHAALPSAIAALLSPRLSVVAATNLVVALHLLLNFVAAYALGWRLTRRHGAALLGGLVFGWSPYIGSHLAGHFNLVAAWILPVAAHLAIDTLERGGRLRGAALGAALGTAAFVDYYHAVYAAIVVALIACARSMTMERAASGRRRWQRAALRSIALLAAAVVLILLAVAATGGGVLSAGGLRVSIRGTRNLVAALGLLALAAIAVASLPSARLRAVAPRLREDARRLAAPIAVAIAVASPILVSLARLWLRGDYVSQRYFWRSAPPGVDVATMVLGNPAGLSWSGLPLRAYGALGIDGVEQVAWFGPGTIALAAAAWMLRRRDPALRPWFVTAAVFLVWALGPMLVAFGRDTGVLLPAMLVRFVPIVSNARIPARAIVVVYLAAAVLAAYGYAALRDRGRSRLALALLLLVVLDGFPAPARVYVIERSPVHDALASRAEPGAVCDLPLGLRDGFGERGRFDSRVLLFQTVHGRAICGGFVARLSPRVAAFYESDFALGPLLRLSERRPLAEEQTPDVDRVSAALLTHGIRFLVVDVRAAPPDLLEFVRERIRARRIMSADGRDLYEVVQPAGVR